MRPAADPPTPAPERFPLVSIVIPVYRGQPFLPQAIETALAQSWPEIEVIVVDDGSDDDGATRTMIARYGDRVRHIEKPNGGVATALNAGIAAMKGDYFSWLSHDDRYHPRKIETQMRVMQGLRDPAVLFGDYDLIAESGAHHARLDSAKGYDPAQPIWAVLEGRLNGCTLLIPRLCFERCGMFSPGLPTTQDYALWFRMARDFPFLHVPGPLVQHRMHPGQGSKIPRHIEEASLLWLSMLDRLTEAEMIASAGSRPRFLIRALRFLRLAGYQGVTARIEQELRDLLRQRACTLIWGGSGQAFGATLAEAVAQIERAGPKVARVLIVETAASAAPLGAETLLPAGLDCRSYRVTDRDVVRAVLDLARAAPTDTVILADAARPLTAATLGHDLERLYMNESDIVLRREGRTPRIPARARFCLPAALSGAILSAEALRRLGPGEISAETALAELLQGLRVDIGGPCPSPPAPPEPPPAPPAPGILSMSRDPERPTLLVVSRGRGGGAARYAEHLGGLAARRCNVLYASGLDDAVIRLSAASPDRPELAFDLPDQLDACIAVLKDWQVGRVDVVHTDGLRAHLPELLDRLGVPFDLTLVDFHMIAGAPHLEASAGDPARAPLPPALLAAAERRIAISRHTARLCAEIAPDLAFIAARLAEPSNPRGFDLHPVPLREGEALRAVLLAPLVRHKGSEIVFEVARRCRRDRVAIEFHVTGWPGNPLPDLADQENLRLHDLRDPAELNRFVCLVRPHLAWLPLIAPETHSFVTSDAMLQGLPILASAVGALPERLEGRDSTWLVEPAADPAAHERWLRRLLDERLGTAPHWLPTGHLPPLQPDFYPDAYLHPLLCGKTAAERDKDLITPGCR